MPTKNPTAVNIVTFTTANSSADRSTHMINSQLSQLRCMLHNNETVSHFAVTAIVWWWALLFRHTTPQTDRRTDRQTPL